MESRAPFPGLRPQIDFRDYRDCETTDDGDVTSLLIAFRKLMDSELMACDRE